VKEKEILFLINDEVLTYKETGKLDITYDEYLKIKKIILSDLNYDIKLLSIPDVREEVRKNIIVNSVKKHSLVEINENNVDYKVLYEENDKLKVLVFIKKDTDIDNDNKKIFTIYHLLEGLILKGCYPIQTSFLINYGKVFFLYDFNNGFFIKRSIIPEKELVNLKEREKNIYCININKEIPDNFNFNLIPHNNINEAVFNLKKNLFNKIKDFEFKKNLVIGLLLSIFIIILIELNINHKKNENSKIIKELKIKENILKEEKTKRGISDKLFKEYSFLIKNKSRINEFFYLLNDIGKNNIEIDGISFSENKFSINGICDNDSLLEDNFRESDYFTNINFSFTKKEKKILFRIDGEYRYE